MSGRARGGLVLGAVAIALVLAVFLTERERGDGVRRAAANREGGATTQPRSDEGERERSDSEDDISMVGLRREEGDAGVPGDGVPDCYRGPARLSGVVVDRAGAPVVGAHVHVRMSGIRPYSAVQRAYLHTRTEHDGSFSFPSLPIADRFHVAACLPFRIAMRDLGGLHDERVELVLPPAARYERYAFFDEAGPAVSVERAQRIGGRPFDDMTDRDTWMFRDWTALEGFLPESERPGPHEYVRVSRATGAATGAEFLSSDPDAGWMRSLWIPGCRVTKLDGPSYAPEEWPRATRVVLERGAFAEQYKEYEVDFDGVALPEAWRRFEGVDGWEPLAIRAGPEAGARWVSGGVPPSTVTPRRPWLAMPPGASFHLSLASWRGDPSIPYRIDGSRVVPDWPAYAYLTIRRSPDDPTRARQRWFLLGPKGKADGFLTHSVRLFPGLDVLGPIPPGAYVIRYASALTLLGAPAAPPAWKPLGPLKPGHHVLDWED